jgi:hypothetical protein
VILAKPENFRQALDRPFAISVIPENITVGPGCHLLMNAQHALRASIFQDRA